MEKFHVQVIKICGVDFFWLCFALTISAANRVFLTDCILYP